MKRSYWVLVILICAMILGTAGLSWGQSRTLKIGAPIPLGGVGGAYVGLGWGYNDCQAYLTDKGGIKGNKVTYLVEDNRWDVTTEIAIINRQLSREPKEELVLFCGNLITGTLKAMSEKINKEVRIPSIALSFSVEMFGKQGGPSKYPYYFTTGPDYSEQIGLLLRYIKKDHKRKFAGKKEEPPFWKQISEEGEGAPPKLAVVYSPTEYGRDPLADLKVDAAKLGIKIVAEEEVAVTASDVSAQIINIRKAQPDYLIWHGFLPGMLVAPVFLKTARQYLPKVPILGTDFQTSPTMIAAGGPAADGIIGVNTRVHWQETDNPFIKLVQGQAAKRERKIPWAEQSNYILGWTMALLGAHALEAAAETGDFSREGVKKAMENSVWDFHGMYGGKKFSYKSHKNPMARIYKASAAKKEWDPITPWLNVDEELK